MSETRKIDQFFKNVPWRFLVRASIIQTILMGLGLGLSFFITANILKDFEIKRVSQFMEETLVLGKYSSLDQWCSKKSNGRIYRYLIIGADRKIVCDSKEKAKNLIWPNIIGPKLGTVKLPNEEQEFLFRKKLVGEGKSDVIFVVLYSQDQLSFYSRKLNVTYLLLLLPFILIAGIWPIWFSSRLTILIRNIFAKIRKLKKSIKDFSPDQFEGKSDWAMIEEGMEQARDDLEEYVGDLRLENQKFTALLKSISDSILAVGRDGTVLFVNQQFKITFLTSPLKRENYSTTLAWDFIKDEIVQEMFEEVMAKNKRRRHGPIEYIHPRSNERLYFHLTVGPIRNFQGEAFGAVLVFHDISEQIKVSQMRENFVANVSHEIRTPLTALKGYSQLLKNSLDEPSEEVAGCLERIERNSERLINLFNDLLDLSVIEARQRIEKEKVPVKELTHNVIMNIKQNHSGRELQFEEVYGVDSVKADPGLLEQVLTNLVDNAVKYCPNDLVVKIEWTSVKDGTYLIVEDNGPGIAEEYQARLFERFYRADRSRSRELGGTGLGLAIVKHITQKHGGKVELSSRPGQGSRFIVFLPKK